MQEQIEIKPLENLVAEITAPPSKAHTLRALFIAAMAKGKTRLRNPLLADDQKYAMVALKELGVKINPFPHDLVIQGVDGKFDYSGRNLYIGNSGFSARVLTVLASLADDDVLITGNEKMITDRPLQDLLNAIKPLGINANSHLKHGFLPVTVEGKRFKGGKTRLKGDKSSQYFSAIMMCAPYAENPVFIETIRDLVSKPFIDITISMMEDFGVQVVNLDYKKFAIYTSQRYFGRDYQIEGDYGGASFFFEAAAIAQGRVRVNNLNPDSTQGEKIFPNLLAEMGCEVNKGKDYVEVVGKPLKAIRVDMKNYPDIVTPLAVTAAFAQGTSEFYGISHLRIKESNRLTAPVEELRKMGIEAECTEDSLFVTGGNSIHGAEIDSHGDHRMVMSFAPAGLVVPNIIINNPGDAHKSNTVFWQDFETLYKN